MPRKGGRGQPMFGCIRFCFCVIGTSTHIGFSGPGIRDGRWIIGGSVQSLVVTFMAPHWSSLHSFKAETKRPQTYMALEEEGSCFLPGGYILNLETFLDIME